MSQMYLTNEFLQQYVGKHPNWGFDGLGFIVYVRTYARTKEDGTLEQWWETCKRVTEGNFSIEANRLEELGKFTNKRRTDLNKEMERFYHLFFNLVICPPGRGLWMSGTKYAERVGDAENNCWFVSMKPQSYNQTDFPDVKKVSFAPCFTFDQAMKGGGVGVTVLRKYVEQIPKVRNHVQLSFLCEVKHKDYLKMLDIPEVSRKVSTLHSNYFKPEDNREGWVECLRRLIDFHFDVDQPLYTKLIIDVSGIRAEGEPIKGFGGVASGPVPLIKMLLLVNEILNDRLTTKLTPTEWGDIIQLVGNCVIAGNVRRMALILIGDLEDKQFVESKNYSLPENQKAAQWRWASNNSVDISAAATDEQLTEVAKNIYYNGEPGYTNIELAQNSGRLLDGINLGVDPDVEGFNPCFTGDMLLLTSDGYKTFYELDGKVVSLINSSGKLVEGSVWKTGVREVVELRSIKNSPIRCTPDHVFQTVEGKSVVAKDLKGCRLMPALVHLLQEDPLYVKLGFIQGNGILSNLASENHNGVTICLGKKDLDMKNYFGVTDEDLMGKEKRCWYTKEFTKKLEELEFGLVNSWDRIFPLTYDTWTKKQKASFLRGCYSANGAVVSAERVTYRSTSYSFLAQLQYSLERDFQIRSYVTTDKPFKTKFKHGNSYLTKERYVLNVSSFHDKLSFYNEIGFVHTYKMQSLEEMLKRTSPKIVSVKHGGTRDVFDFNEPISNWGIVEGFVAHNCGEVPLENAGNCNLFELNLARIEQLIQAGLATDALYDEAAYLGARYAYRVTFRNYEWVTTRLVVEKNRRTGVGITGVTDWSLLRYGFPAVIGWLENGNPIYHPQVETDLDTLYKTVRQTNKEQSLELEGNPSIKVTTVKPSGTVSLLMGVSPGMHYHWAAYMIRRVRIASNSPLIDSLKKCGYPHEFVINGFHDDGTPKYNPGTVVFSFPIKAPTAEHPQFLSAKDVSLEEQAALQVLLQKYWSDNSVSATLSFHKPMPRPVYFNDGSQLLDKMGQPTLLIQPLEEKATIRRLANVLIKYKGILKSTTMLPYATDTYPQMPYEEITEQQYLELKEKITGKPWEYLGQTIKGTNEELDTSMECVGGSCPLR